MADVREARSLSPSTRKLMALLAGAQAPARDWRKAWRLAFAQLRQEVDLHPIGATPAATFAAAAASVRTVSAENLPLAMGLVMHLYPLCALRFIPLPWWSAASYRRHRLLRDIDREGWILANAGSERVAGAQSPISLTRTFHGALVTGAFDYVSLANVADLVLFNAPLDGQVSLFCIASMHMDTAIIGEPRFSGATRLSDTCSLRLEKHLVRNEHCVVVPNDTTLGCMTQYQRSWFQMLAAEAHLARLDFLRKRWQLPHTPEDIAGWNEVKLLRDYALRLLDGARTAGTIESLASVTAAIKLRISWRCQAMAEPLRELDATAAAELLLLKRQPTADDRILRSISSVDQPLVVNHRHISLPGGGHATKAAT